MFSGISVLIFCSFSDDICTSAALIQTVSSIYLISLVRKFLSVSSDCGSVGQIHMCHQSKVTITKMFYNFCKIHRLYLVNVKTWKNILKNGTRGLRFAQVSRLHVMPHGQKTNNRLMYLNIRLHQQLQLSHVSL